MEYMVVDSVDLYVYERITGRFIHWFLHHLKLCPPPFYITNKSEKLFISSQQRVYEEVIDILGHDRIVIASDLPKLKYTERVIKENLRIFPIAAVFARSLEEDIDIGDALLPAGSSAAFITLFIHRNPKYWRDPLKFDPDRFLPEEVAKRHPCTYIPFSYGPRNCIGWKYAIANMKTIIATVIRQFKIYTEYKSVEEIEINLYLLMRMRDGPKVWLENR